MGPLRFNHESLSFALANIMAHRFRSLLTVLGIISGIVTVVLVASVLVGVRRNIVNLFQEFGSDNVFAFHLQGDPYTPRIRPEEVTRKPLKLEYSEQLLRACPSLREVAAQLIVPTVVGDRALVAKYRGIENDRILLEGCTSNFVQVTNGELSQGRVYTPDEEKRRARVCILGANIANALFPSENPIGKRLQVDQALFEVVGVLQKRKGSFFGENRQDNVVTVPALTVRSRYPGAENVVLYCQARPGLREQALGEIEAELRRVRGLKPGQENDFYLSTADLIVEQLDRVTAIIRLATLAISGLALLVGGIGVMNVMLMSVTQRTREIGIRKAVGARKRDIVWQFLLEAVLLTGMGGATGVAFAALVGFAVSWLVPALPAVPPVWAVLTALAMSGAVGIVFGVWPALKAAGMDPVEALRYE